MLFDTILPIAQSLGQALLAQHARITTAESCTAGLLSAAITAVAGSSQWFGTGFVTYSNEAKQNLLAISPQLLLQYGAVSEPVAIAMAQSALTKAQAQFSIAITGIAGPDGGTKEKPVGTVCFAWCKPNSSQSQKCLFTGDRHAIRIHSIHHALAHALEILAKS